jgi:hypothetical protein
LYTCCKITTPGSYKLSNACIAAFQIAECDCGRLRNGLRVGRFVPQFAGLANFKNLGYNGKREEKA